jgi:hypothetical protein
MTKKDALIKLYEHRENIENHLAEIDAILQVYFSDDYSVAYQHWIPQIKTALYDNTKWLSRGQYSMDYTIKSILDKIVGDSQKGVSKYIK